MVINNLYLVLGFILIYNKYERGNSYLKPWEIVKQMEKFLFSILIYIHYNRRSENPFGCDPIITSEVGDVFISVTH